MKKLWRGVMGVAFASLVTFSIAFGLVGIRSPLPDHHGLEGVKTLQGAEVEVVLPMSAFKNHSISNSFAVDEDHSLWVVSGGEVWRASEVDDSIHWQYLNHDWKGLSNIARARNGALLAVRGHRLTQYSKFIENQKGLMKLVSWDGILLPHTGMQLASSNLPGTIYAFGTGINIDARRVYAFYEPGEVAIVCEVPEDVQAVADGREGLYVATPHEIYRFDINGKDMGILLRLAPQHPPIRSLAVTEDERTLVWSTDDNIYVMEGEISIQLVLGFGGTVRIRDDSLYAFSPTRRSLIRIKLPTPRETDQ